MVTKELFEFAYFDSGNSFQQSTIDSPDLDKIITFMNPCVHACEKATAARGSDLRLELIVFVETSIEWGAVAPGAPGMAAAFLLAFLQCLERLPHRQNKY